MQRLTGNLCYGNHGFRCQRAGGQFLLALNVVGRIRHGHLSTSFAPPFVQALAEIRNPGTLLRRYIILLLRISGEIVQLDSTVLVKLDQLPTAGANRAVGTRASG